MFAFTKNNHFGKNAMLFYDSCNTMASPVLSPLSSRLCSGFSKNVDAKCQKSSTKGKAFFHTLPKTNS